MKKIPHCACGRPGVKLKNRLGVCEFCLRMESGFKPHNHGDGRKRKQAWLADANPA